ncbi:MAG: EAL domain-containing protein [Rhodocyclaceae bacterium]
MGARIMVVEDERIVALDLKGGLESLGYDVVGLAARGDEAIEQAGNLRPDLILMDINLEGPMDGTEAARHIHDEYRLPVIYLTAYAAEKTLARAEASAPYGYLLKPFELRELEATVRMALARRKVEIEVEHSEERLRLAINAASLGVWEWSSGEERYQLSPYMDKLLGNGHLVLNEGRPGLLQRIHPDDRNAVATALEGGGQVSTTVRMLFSDDREGWVELHATSANALPPLPGANSSARPGDRVIGVLRDVTDRRRIEEELRQASVVFQSTAEGILITNARREIISVNGAFTALTGYAADDVIGRDPETFLHARRHNDHFYPDLDLPGHGFWQGEVACRRANGHVFPSWQHICAVRDEQSQLTHFVVTFSDISGIRKAEAQINHMAYHDALTGLGNRNQLEKVLENELPRHAEAQQKLALIFIDLDGFKLINDTLGHTAGDQMLQVIAGRLRDCLRRDDLAIRLGGDEFVIVLNDIKRADNCARLCDKLLRQIRAPIELPFERISVSASLGIAVFPDDANNRQGLIKAADSAMYEAKSRGRNRYAFYSPEMAARTRERLLLEQGLMRAVEDDTLTLHYQPIVSLADSRMVGMEALVRWNHPQLGLVPPDRFIRVAEESGLIDGIGEWVMRSACQQAVEWWRLHPQHPLLLSVNVSVREMASDNFVDRVARVLMETGLQPAQLEIEITESTLQSIEYSQGLLYRLKKLGVRLAIDDFGTGFSSLGLLKHLPIDRIKIDRSFVRDLPDDTSDVAITRAIAAMAHSLDMQITAEGIEQTSQHHLLRDIGCQCGQGYLFSEPLPRDEFARLLGPDAAPARLIPSA